jgi:hypothetical protein
MGDELPERRLLAARLPRELSARFDGDADVRIRLASPNVVTVADPTRDERDITDSALSPSRPDAARTRS